MNLTGNATADPRYVAALAVAALAVAEPVLRGRQALHLLDAVIIENMSDPAALWLLGMAAHAVGAPVHAVDFFGRAETRLRQQGRLGLLSQVLVMQSLDLLELGDWERALAALEEGRQLAKETGQPIWDTGSLSIRCLVLGLRGQADEALAMAAEVERAAGGRRLGDLLACVQVARGFALINLGECGQAYEELRRAFDPDDPAFHATERFHAVMYLAEAALHTGRTNEARAVAAALEADAAVTPSPTLHLHLAYARAVLAGDDEAEKLFTEALGADLVRWPWLRARMAPEESDALYQRWRIPAPGKPLFEAAGANFSPHSPAKVDTGNSGRGPLLLIMGGRDHTVPEAITKSTLKQYRGSDAVTDLAEFPDRGHSLTIDGGGIEVAGECLSWLAKQGY
jgi:tetratricopeptide (TPR) repeat protein